MMKKNNSNSSDNRPDITEIIRNLKSIDMVFIVDDARKVSHEDIQRMVEEAKKKENSDH